MIRAAAILLLLSSAARAEPAYVRFTTWLRDAPDIGARVIDEINSGVQLEKGGCEHGWCRVAWGRASGWVADGMLSPTPIPGPPTPGEGCFPASHFTPAGPVALRVCPAR